ARLVGLKLPVVAEYAWPLWWAAEWFRPEAVALPTWAWWAAESAAEVLAAFLLTRYGPLLFWALNRFVLDPLLIVPTEWSMKVMTAGYARLLRWSLRHWGVVLGFGAVLIVIAFVFLYYDLLGRELVPSEDQSRFVVHITCPVGSSIDHIDELLQECEARLT